MTVEEIKQQYSMRDVAERYGLYPNRAGFLHCPFHEGDRTASLKIYKDSYYCFGCQAHGDIFSFVQRMDDCTFKEAFKTLGGDSSPLSDAAITRIAKRKREAQKYKKRLDGAQNETVTASDEYLEAKKALESLEPFSDEWCAMQNKIQTLRQQADKSLETYLDTISEGK